MLSLDRAADDDDSHPNDGEITQLARPNKPAPLRLSRILVVMASRGKHQQQKRESLSSKADRWDDYWSGLQCVYTLSS